MPLSQDTLRFIREHRCDDVRSLALQARRYPSVDMPAAITQISGWQIAKEKIPAWAENEHILYPAHLSLEQCSSQATAQYKAEIITNLLHTEQEHPAQNSTPHQPAPLPTSPEVSASTAPISPPASGMPLTSSARKPSAR